MSVAPWQAATLAALGERFDAGRLPHALLLDGPGGWGKRFFARQLARRLLGLPAADADAFAWGDDVADADLLRHPDARIVKRTPGTSGRLRQQITVDEVRALGEFLVRTSSDGGTRVVILELAEELNVAAGNALLKRLEEPGRATHLLLVTHGASRVLATIRSRCQRVVMAPGTQDEAEAWFAARRPELDDAARAELLEAAGGAPLRADALADAGVTELAASVRAVLDGGPIEDLVDADTRRDPDEARARAALVLDLLYRALGDRARSAARAGAGLRPPVAQLDRVLRARRQLASQSNPNVTLLLEDLLLGLRPARDR
jgi:DNA polymerase-3 subunit delta'